MTKKELLQMELETTLSRMFTREGSIDFRTGALQRMTIKELESLKAMLDA